MDRHKCPVLPLSALSLAPTGLIAAIQAVVPGQEKVEGAAILVTGGSLALVAENHNIVSMGDGISRMPSLWAFAHQRACSPICSGVI